MIIILRVLLEVNRPQPFIGHIFNVRWNGVNYEFVDDNGHVCVDYLPAPADKKIEEAYELFSSYSVAVYELQDWPFTRTLFDSRNSIQELSPSASP